MILRRTKPNIRDITVKEIMKHVIITCNRVGYDHDEIMILNIVKSIMNIFTIYNINISKTLDYWLFIYYYNIPIGQEDAHEDFRVNFVEQMIEKLPDLMDKIKIHELNVDKLKMWMFAPACEYVHKPHLQDNSDNVFYQHYKNDIYLRIIGNKENSADIFQHHQAALFVLTSLYNIMIINSFNLDTDIVSYLKLLYFNDFKIFDVKFM
jgi:hypothetical protein